MSTMLSVDAAREKLTRIVTPVSGEETVPLDDARNRIIACNIHAPIDLPPFESSAMDGYAVRSVDCGNAGSIRLQCVGISRAGAPFEGTVGQDEAVRIFTGAEVPEECDAVVLQEDVVSDDRSVSFDTRVTAGMNVRARGNDVTHGAIICRAGDCIGPYDIGWLAACGIPSVRVRRRIRVAVCSTGDELQEPGQPLGKGRIYDSNRRLLRHLLTSKPVTIWNLDRLPDDPVTIEKSLLEVKGQADVVITTGGVSVGDADFVRPVVEKIGQLDFWNIALKPGKPLAVGTIGDTLFIGLPGNPISTIVTYLLFVVPAIDQLSGTHTGAPYEFSAKLANDLKHSLGRREYQRGTFVVRQGEILVKTNADQGSNRLSSMNQANCLIVVPENVGSLDAGAHVRILMLPHVSNHLWESLA